MQPICNPLNPAFNFGFIYLPQHCCTYSQRNAMNTSVSYVVNPATLEDGFYALVKYKSY